MKNLMKAEILVPTLVVAGILGLVIIGGTMNKSSSGAQQQAHSHGGGTAHMH